MIDLYLFCIYIITPRDTESFVLHLLIRNVKNKWSNANSCPFHSLKTMISSHKTSLASYKK